LDGVDLGQQVMVNLFRDPLGAAGLHMLVPLPFDLYRGRPVDAG
jgi:hypothetical protein